MKTVIFVRSGIIAIRFDEESFFSIILGFNHGWDFIEVDLRNHDNIKEKAKNFPFCPENKNIHEDKNNDYMKKIKSKNYTIAKKLIRDWTDKKNYLVKCKMLEFYVRHGMIVDKIHEIISFKQSKWLEKYENFNTQKRNKAIKHFEKDFYELLKNAFYEKNDGKS